MGKRALSHFCLYILWDMFRESTQPCSLPPFGRTRCCCSPGDHLICVITFKSTLVSSLDEWKSNADSELFAAWSNKIRELLAPNQKWNHLIRESLLGALKRKKKKITQQLGEAKLRCHMSNSICKREIGSKNFKRSKQKPRWGDYHRAGQAAEGRGKTQKQSESVCETQRVMRGWGGLCWPRRLSEFHQRAQFEPESQGPVKYDRSAVHAEHTHTGQTGRRQPNTAGAPFFFSTKTEQEKWLTSWGAAVSAACSSWHWQCGSDHETKAAKWTGAIQTVIA